MMKVLLSIFLATSITTGILLDPAGPVHAITMPRVNLQPNVTYHYEYTISDPTGVRLDRTGALQLRFTRDNIISGYYDPNDFLSFIPVTGGRDGNQFWLEIGSSVMHLLRINGTIHTDGSLSGYAYRGASVHEFLFKAALKK